MERGDLQKQRRGLRRRRRTDKQERWGEWECVRGGGGGWGGCTAAANGKVLPHSPSRTLNANQRICRLVTQARDPITSTAAGCSSA